MTTPLSHHETQQALEAIFVGDSPPFDVLRLRAHLRTCPECRACFDELAQADAWMGGGRDDEESFEMRYSRLLMETAKYQADTLAAKSPTHISIWDRIKHLLWSPQGGAVLAFACAAAVLFATGVLGEHTPKHPEHNAHDTLQARGAHTSSNARPVGWVEPFCVKNVDESPTFQEPHSKTRRVLCEGAQELQFALVNHASHNAAPWRYGTLVGVSKGEGELRVFNPLPAISAKSPSFRLPTAPVMAPLGTRVQLQPEERQGSVRLVVVLSQDPVSMRSLRELHRTGSLHDENMRSSLSGRLAVFSKQSKQRELALDDDAHNIWSVSAFWLEFGAQK